jgi:Arc/MetJ-type ribon-helix-helix transcriptional regulator
MTLTVGPKTERLIEEQMSTGHFPDAESVLQAALLGLSHSDADVELDEEDISAINEADAQGERGEAVELSVFRAEFMNRPLES